MRPLVDPSTIVLVVLALVLAAVAYLKDPGLPLIGAKNGFSMLRFILPRLVPALMLAGLMQVLIPQEVVSRHFGRAGEVARDHLLRSEEHTSELQSRQYIVCRLLLEKKKHWRVGRFSPAAF